MDSLTTTPSSAAVPGTTGPEQYLRVLSSRPSPGVEVCTPVGEIDLYTTPVLRHALRDAEQRPVPRLFIDLTRVEFLGVAGIHVLITAAQQARARSSQLALICATRHVQRALEAAGALEALVTYRSLSEAVTALTIPQHPEDGARHRREEDEDDDEVTERADWGLRRYVEQVALALGVGMESACCEGAAEPASAYLALTQRLPSAPDRDVALFWDAAHGWALGVETGSSEDILVTAYLGGAQSMADPDTVAVFAKTILSGQDAGRPTAPTWPGDGDLTSQLANYATPDTWSN